MPLSRYFRFRLRTLLVVTTLVGVGCWLVPQWQLVQARKAALRELGRSASISIERQGELPWVRRMMGDSFVFGLILSGQSGDEEFNERIVRLFPESPAIYF